MWLRPQFCPSRRGRGCGNNSACPRQRGSSRASGEGAEIVAARGLWPARSAVSNYRQGFPHRPAEAGEDQLQFRFYWQAEAARRGNRSLERAREGPGKAKQAGPRTSPRRTVEWPGCWADGRVGCLAHVVIRHGVKMNLVSLFFCL